MSHVSAILNPVTEVIELLTRWEDDHRNPNSEWRPKIILEKLNEIIERETAEYIRRDPDPFDDRHPSQLDPSCALGQVLKPILKREQLMSTLTSDYLTDSTSADSDVLGLNTAAARFLLNIMPGIEAALFFQDANGLIQRLFSWAESGPDPLAPYALGILGHIMEVQEISSTEDCLRANARLAPIVLGRLRALQEEMLADHKTKKKREVNLKRPFSMLSSGPEEASTTKDAEREASPAPKRPRIVAVQSLRPSEVTSENAVDEGGTPSSSLVNGDVETKVPETPSIPTKDQPVKKLEARLHVPSSVRVRRFSSPPPPLLMSPPQAPSTPNKEGHALSNSSWAEMEAQVVGSIPLHPLGLDGKQGLILRYLAPLGEYQEFLSIFLGQDALSLTLRYVEHKSVFHSRLIFQALRFLASFLCHKKICLDFLHARGIEKLLTLPRPSVAATGTSMCFYYLTCSEEAMEELHHYPRAMLQQLVAFMLWLLECSHETARVYAVMSFGTFFQYKTFLSLFDEQDGLRLMYNMVATFKLLDPDVQDTLSEEESLLSRQAIRQIAVALRSYFDAHLVLLIKESSDLTASRQSLATAGAKEPGSAASSKWSVRSPIVMADYIRAAEEIFARRGPKRWKPVTEFLQLGGIQLFLHLVSSASTWNFVGRSEMVKACLDIIAICSTVGRVQENLCQFSSRLRQPLRANNLDEEYPQSPGPPCSGVTIILSATDGEVFRDADVQKSALLILIAILCCPRPSTDLPEGTQVRMSEVTRKAVNCVRRNHGILCLLKHLMAKSPLMEADCLRALACEALAGFAVKDESVRQILGKHFLFTSGQFQPLLREPLLQERKSEHARFVNCALDLMDAVSGGRRPLPPNPHEVSLDTLHRANIVAHTPIRFSSRDLATLIHRHLEEKGWRKAAEALAREAGLSPMGGSGPMPSPQIQSRSQGCSSSVSLRSPPPPDSTSPLPPPLSTPLRLNLVRLAPPRSTPKAAIVGCRPSLACTPCHPEAMIRQPQITLTDIINKYLMNQHALCRNPIATCPEFDLFSPHHCPEPQTRFKTPLNLAVRMQRRAIHPPDGGPHGAALTRKYIYSRFRPMMLHRNLENEDECCTCVAFTPYDPSCVYVGNENGDLKVVQIGSGHLETSYQCHDARLDKVYCNKDGSLVLTCSNRHSISLSSLWSVGEFFDLKFPLEGAEHSVFANESNKILCTRHEEADIVDIATGRTVLRLVPEENNYNGYLDNRAAFSPDDEMVLNDGLLWDVRSAKPIHKFDKFNSLVNGVFHPLGLEILSSSEVWDIRTFRLLHNVPSMDGCYPTFTSTGDVFFAFRHYYFDSEAMEDRETSFRSYDARDYSLIATTDVRKVVADLVVDPRDQHLAVVENSWDDNEGSGLDSIVRVYEIGRVREEDEAQDEEEGEGALSDDDDSSSDDEDEEGPGDRGEGRWIRQVLGAMSTENEALDSSRGEEGAGGEAEGDGRRSDSDDGTVLLSLSSDSDSVEDEEETSEEEDIDSDGLFSLGDDTTNDSYP